MWMNEYDVEDAVRRFDDTDTPNLAEGARILSRLVDWTNRNSDGWPYWQKPARAADRLMNLLQGVDRFDPQDISAADLKAALTPIKTFLTRQGVDHAPILQGPTRREVLRDEARAILREVVEVETDFTFTHNDNDPTTFDDYVADVVQRLERHLSGESPLRGYR